MPPGRTDYPRRGNVAAETISDPDPEAFAKRSKRADVVVEDEFRTPSASTRRTSSRRAPSAIFANGRYIVHAASQYPFNVRDRVAQFLGVRPSTSA